MLCILNFTIEVNEIKIRAKFGVLVLTVLP